MITLLLLPNRFVGSFPVDSAPHTERSFNNRKGFPHGCAGILSYPALSVTEQSLSCKHGFPFFDPIRFRTSSSVFSCSSSRFLYDDKYMKIWSNFKTKSSLRSDKNSESDNRDYCGDIGDNNNNNNNNNNNGNNSNNNRHNEDDSLGSFNLRKLFLDFVLFISQVYATVVSVAGKCMKKVALVMFVSLFIFVCPFHWNFSSALSKALQIPSIEFVWEVRGSKWIKIKLADDEDAFVVDTQDSSLSGISNLHPSLSWGKQVVHTIMQFLLPEGYPESVSSDYLEYSLWRAVQGVASQASGVLSTQALLYAVGLGKGAIPTAAAMNWVLKDGIGYLSKILLSKYGRHFDVHPKGWRLFADLLENTAYGLELLTPVFPQYFVFIGAAAGAGRSAAVLIQAATRSCFCAGFAAQRNFAEVIAKGEAQGMVSKFLGIMLGIALAKCVGSSTALTAAAFGVITGIHMYANLKSYQSIHLRTLNPYRASLLFSEYLLTGQVPVVKEVNDEEPLFPALPIINVSFLSQVGAKSALSPEAKDAAANIECRLQLGSKLSDIVCSKEEMSALFELFQDESYLMVEHRRNFCVVLKEGYTPHDMLKSLFHVSYLYWLEKYAGIESKSIVDDCKVGGKLQISLDYVQREFDHAKRDGQIVGWLTDGLVARPLPYRIRPVCGSCSSQSLK